MNSARLSVVLWIILMCQGCASSIDSDASRLGMVASTIQSQPFKHRLFSLATKNSDAHSVKVFLLDGDGRAFINPTTVARDPTPLRSSLLSMAPEIAELGNVFYLGRPCYHRLNDPECDPLHWTLARYSQSIVDSSAKAAKQLIQRGDRVILVGYSGGGVIAMLMARQMYPDVFGVLTYGSPLDTDAWTSLHGYSSLVLSENPARDVESFHNLCQLHLFGDRDQVVPGSLVASWKWLSPHQQSQETLVPSDHVCCWQSPVLLAVTSLLKTCAAS